MKDQQGLGPQWQREEHLKPVAPSRIETETQSWKKWRSKPAHTADESSTISASDVGLSCLTG